MGEDAQLVLLEADDLMHPNEGQPNFNESAYYNFYDPKVRTGGFVRLGNRPNEGHAEMTVCLYLPDGRVAFMYRRPEIASNDAFDAGGLRFDVQAPFRKHRITYSGTACLLDDPLEMADPRDAFRTNPHVPVELDVKYLGLSPGYGGELRIRSADGWKPAERSGAAVEFARGHLEQHGKAVGQLRIAGDTFSLDAPGLRDHSWGPRSWQAPKSYRWFPMAFGEDLGICPARTVLRDGRVIESGYLYRRGRENELLANVDIDTERGGEQDLHERMTIRCSTAGGEAIEIHGRVLSMIPLRNRKDGKITRIAEGLTEFRWRDRIGYGLSEYLDHLVD